MYKNTETTRSIKQNVTCGPHYPAYGTPTLVAPLAFKRVTNVCWHHLPSIKTTSLQSKQSTPAWKNINTFNGKLPQLARYPLRGNHQLCLICMKYRIIILIIIIISLGQILLSYWKHITRARTYTHTAEPFGLALCNWSVAPNRDGPCRWWQWARCFIQINTCEGDPASRGFVCFSRIKKLLGRTETRTCDRMYCQTIRTVWDISRDDRARIATCSLLTSTDRFKENYSIDLGNIEIQHSKTVAYCRSTFWNSQNLFDTRLSF